MFSIPSLYDDKILGGINLSESENTKSMAEDKAAAASNSHKEAERRRRKRINTHMNTLQSILPNLIKKDKASILGEAVRRVMELKKTTAELEEESKKLMFPSETDELKLGKCETSGLIKATLSCDDRPEIIVDMIQALKSAEAKVVRAEMSTVGGRTKSVLWLKFLSQKESDVGLDLLRRALNMVMDKSTLLPGSAQVLPGNKRPRYYHLS